MKVKTAQAMVGTAVAVLVILSVYWMALAHLVK
jgi:hypothetical protein